MSGGIGNADRGSTGDHRVKKRAALTADRVAEVADFFFFGVFFAIFERTVLYELRVLMALNQRKSKEQLQTLSDVE